VSQVPEEERKVIVRDRRRIDPVSGRARDAGSEPVTGTGGRHAADQGAAAGERPAATEAGGPAQPADELAAARAQVAERTADLQRVTAEYANYRKRVDRDRTAVVEVATGAVLSALLPVLDDIERARAHGDLTGAFKAVADQLETVLEKLGLQPFGEVGEEFDPTMHEAVAHQPSSDVTVPTCVSVLRRGYRQGERLLRPALVAVAAPGPEPASAEEPVAPSDLPTPGVEPDGWRSSAGTPSAGEAAGAPQGRDDRAPDGEEPASWFGGPGDDTEA
jgi:molecular chaperone GrpE